MKFKSGHLEFRFSVDEIAQQNVINGNTLKITGQIQYPDPDERIVINRPKGAPEDIDPKRYTIESQEKGFPAETKVWYNRFQNKATAYVDFNNSIQHSNQFPDKSGVKNHRLPTSKYLIKQIPNNTVDYFKEWKNIISVFSEKTLTRKKYVRMFPKLSVHDAIKDISNWHSSLQLFWPFVLENAVMIQKLALLGISGKIVPKEKQKLAFFQELEKFQTIKIPVAQDKIILSFNHTDLVEGLRRAGLLETSEDYLSAGLHLYKPEDQLNIESKVNAAMDVINKTSPELYLAITQLIGSIAFYKAEHVGYAGGSISSALGVIWQDPRAYKEFSVSHYAEQIVHEFIHNTLFLVDMVKGLFVDQQKFLKAKVWSPIRHQLRSYDRTFHACYVSTGKHTFYICYHLEACICITNLKNSKKTLASISLMNFV